MCSWQAMLPPWTRAPFSNRSATPSTVSWTPEAEARTERIPAFIRPMARRAIERYAESQGLSVVTEAVMDEARGVMGM